MKKLFLLILAALFMFSCDEGSGSDPTYEPDFYFIGVVLVGMIIVFCSVQIEARCSRRVRD